MKPNFNIHILSFVLFLSFAINSHAQTKEGVGSTVCVAREDGYPIADVELIPGIETDASGCHTFDNPDGVIVTPAKISTQEEAVNILDLVILMEYTLMQRPLTIYQKWAADVNNSGTVSAIDFIEMAKLMLGTLSSPLPKVWQFINEETHEESVDISIPGDSYKFIGLKTGDIDYSYNAAGPPDFEDIFLNAEDEILNNGENYLIPVYLSQAENTRGFALRITNPNLTLEFLGVTAPALPGFDDDSYNYDIDHQEITLIWVAPGLDLPNGFPVSKEEPLFILEIRAKANTILSEELTLDASFDNLLKPAIDTAALDIHFEWEDVIINSVASIGQGRSLTLYPNPVSDQLNIKGLTIEDEGIMQIFDATGRLVFISPLQSLTDVSSFAEGLYYVSIKMEDGQTAVIPLVKVD